jgi:small-conductance mechanosensitive channel
MTMFRVSPLLLLLSLLLAFWVGPASAAQPAAAQTVAAPPPEKLAELSKILNDPAVLAWINAQGKAQAEPDTTDVTVGIQDWETQLRSRFHGIFSGMSKVSTEFGGAVTRIRAQARDSGFMPVALIVAIILGGCLIVEWAVRRAMRKAQRDNPIVTRAYVELVPLAAFVMIAGGAFFILEWPPLLRAVILFALLAAIVFRIVYAFSAMALSSGSLSLFMFRRILVFSGIVVLTMAWLALAKPLSIDIDASFAGAFVASIALLVICCEAVWRRPLAATQSLATKIRYTVYFAVLWLLWALGFLLLFWIGVYLVVLPAILPGLDRLTRSFAATRWHDDTADSIRTVLVVHGVRTLVLGVAVAWLAIVWKYNARAFGRDNPLFVSFVFGFFKSAVVLVVAHLGWSITKSLINRKLASVAGDTAQAPEEAARRARLRTLLPIFRNGLAAVLLVITILMVLAEMGVQIGPLIAGAGIFGVAIGFGSQTLVKDVISGVFYLMDDAFRVGEYIQSGSYKGTVESFSLRSVRLRHHRGPIFTVPFGELGAVQNMSRDWAIDKFMLRVTFDADVNKAKKLVKAIGVTLLEDPELGPLIIETLKMKGVEQIGDFGIELAFAFTTVPGYQAMVRRRAYMAIRQAFSENGINFAQPTVHVGGEDKPDAAAAAQVLAAQQKQAAIAAGGATE